MAIIVEDGTGLNNSESYVSVSEFNDYVTKRVIDLTASTEAEKEALLIKAIDYMETITYGEDKLEATQALSFPTINWGLPNDIKKAQMIVAVSIDSGFNPMDTVDRAVKSEQVGSLRTEYMDNANETPVLTAFERVVSPYLSNIGLLVVRA
jgi:hypothetical protein